MLSNIQRVAFDDGRDTMAMNLPLPLSEPFIKKYQSMPLFDQLIDFILIKMLESSTTLIFQKRLDVRMVTTAYDSTFVVLCKDEGPSY